MIVDVKQPLLLVTDEGSEEEVITRLSRVGFDNVLGYLKGGLSAWQSAGKETDSVDRITPEEFAKRYTEDAKIIDVRKEGEYAAEHIAEAYSRPLAYINTWIKDIDPKEHFLSALCRRLQKYDCQQVFFRQEDIVILQKWKVVLVRLN